MPVQVYLVDRSSVRLLENGVDEYVKQIRKRNKAICSKG